MTTITPLEQYNLDRKATSKLLKISIRTVDRYIKQKKLSTQLINGRIWLNKKEVEVFKIPKKETIIVDSVDMSTPQMSIDKGVDKVDTGVDNEVDNVEFIDQDETRGGNKIYKKLYFDTKEELKEKQERLEIANYRVGQLETQVRNSIPMLEYHRETFYKNKKEEKLKNKIEDQGSLIKRISIKLKSEKFNKRVFLIILLMILALQPLWLLLIYKS